MPRSAKRPSGPARIPPVYGMGGPEGKSAGVRMSAGGVHVRQFIGRADGIDVCVRTGAMAGAMVRGVPLLRPAALHPTKPESMGSAPAPAGSPVSELRRQREGSM